MWRRILKGQNTNSTRLAETAITSMSHDPTAHIDPLLRTSEVERIFLTHQQTLMSRDLAALEKQVSIQANLKRVLEQATQNLAPPSAELRTAQARVLQIGRVQLALLNRAQRSLRLLSNLIAGRQCTYETIASQSSTRVSEASAQKDA